MGAGPIEREVKLGAPEGFRLPTLGDFVPGGVTRTGPPLELDATYYDAPDLRLARSGITLRHRVAGAVQVWTLKLPTRAGGGSSSVARREIDLPGPAGTPPEALTALVASRLRTASLEPVVRLRTVRRWLSLLDHAGDQVAEVVDDEVTVLDGDEAVERFREVEVELGVAGSPTLLDALAERLVEAGAGEPDPTPKAVRALGPRAAEPPELAERPLPDEPTSAEVVLAGIRKAVLRLVEHDPVVREGTDAEGVHQARVATRRLRSDLRVFAALLDPIWAETLRDDLQSLGRTLGEVRDTDVLLLRFRRQLDELDAVDWPPALALLEVLRAQRARAMSSLLDELGSRSYLVLLDRLVAAAGGDVPFTELAGHPAREFLPGLARAPYRALTKAARSLDPEPADADLHRLRIKAKRARYAAELAAGVVGRPAQKLADRLGALQDVLGDHQDACVARTWLRGAARGQDPAVVLVAGELMEMQRAEALAHRRAWRAAWKATREEELRSWLT
ncbi:MAG: CHAD domain-containing protein [Acidimicrobiia bacterium]